MTLDDIRKHQCDAHGFDFTGLRALALNCTLKPSGQVSNTDALMQVPLAILQANGIDAEILRPVDFDLQPGIYPDMREHGWLSIVVRHGWRMD